MSIDEPMPPTSEPWAAPAPAVPGMPAAPPGFGAPAPAVPYEPPPAYPRTGYPAMAPPPRRGKAGIVALVVGLSLVALCGLGAAGIAAVIALQPDDEPATVVASAAPSPAPSPQRALQVSDCVSGNTREYVLQACPQGTHRVLALVADEKKCPADTDAVGADSNDQTLCLVSNAAPHAGAPGLGGGIIRVGDCLPNVDVEGVVEVPCAAGKAFHKIVAIVPTAKSCKAPAVRWLDSTGSIGGSGVIFCAADAGGIASPGECVPWVSGRAPVPIVPVSCSTRPVMKFTGRATSSRGCGRYGGSSWYYVDPYNALPHVKYNCYRKLG